MKVIVKLFGIILISFSGLVYADTWTPIAGIPEPAFGVTEEAPDLPSPWDQETAGFYYVCESCPGTSSVPFGTPSSPRRTIPQNMSAGEVVVLAGSNNRLNINFNCTAAAPCFVIADASNPPVANGDSYIDGSYYIVDGVHAHLPLGIYGTTMQIRGNYGAFRNGRITGNLENGGAATSGSNLVVLNNAITDNGNRNAVDDQDRNGVKVNGTYVWIIGNEFARNSGDGVAVADIRTLGQVHHIYVGRNSSHDNKQSGFWVKEAEHVIFSQNIAYNHVPSPSSGGHGMGAQYDSNYVWFLFNEIYDNSSGIGIKSSRDGIGSGHFVIGNYIHDLDSTRYEPNNAYSQGSITSWNNADITIVNNTIENSTTGMVLNGNTGPAHIYNNDISNLLHPEARAIFTADPGDILFNDFNTVSGESSIDAGTAPISQMDPYAVFQSLYGIRIDVDVEGNNRPNQQWDTGAFESQIGAGTRPEPPVLVTDE